jgi:hypothetical protein
MGKVCEVDFEDTYKLNLYNQWIWRVRICAFCIAEAFLDVRKSRATLMLPLFVTRFIFCRATLELHATWGSKLEYHPKCVPPLPALFMSEQLLVAGLIREVAIGTGATLSYPVTMA